MVDYAQTLSVTPTRVLPKRFYRNHKEYRFHGPAVDIYHLSDTLIDAEMQWDNITDADRSTIFDWYHDSNKANGSAKTFYWAHPRDNEVFETRFLTPIMTVFEPGLKSIDKVLLRLHENLGQAYSDYTDMSLYVESGTYMLFI